MKRFAIILAILIALVLIFQYLFLPFFLRHEKVQEKILHLISEETKGTVQFNRFSLQVFPSLQFQIKEITYESRNTKEPLLFKADFLKARLDLFSILGRQIRLKDLTIKNADISGETRAFSNKPVPFELKGFSIDARGIRKKSLGSFRARGKLFSEEDNFEVTGSLHLEDISYFGWEKMLCDLDFRLNQVPLEPILIHRLQFLPLKVIGGEVTGNIHLIKKSLDRKGEWKADLEFQNIRYADPKNPALSFPKSSQSWTSQGGWDTTSGKLSIISSKLTAPGIDAELIGDFFITDRGLQNFDAHVACREYDFGKARKLFPFLSYWFQNGVEAEGKSEIRFQTKGNFDSFFFHGELVLDEASIRHEYFQKTKDKPLNLKVNVNLENKAKWSGEFDFRYEELRLKGTLLEFRPATDSLRFTLLTNKFRPTTFLEATASINEKIFWDGQLKVLLSYKGKWGDPDNAKIQGIVNLDQIAYGLKGVPFKTPPLTAVLKIEDTEIFSEDSYLEFGEAKAPFELHWKGWAAPRVDWKVTADEVDLSTLFLGFKTKSKTEADEDAFEPSAESRHTEKMSEEEEDELPIKKLPGTLPPWLEKLKALGDVRINSVKAGEAFFEPVTGNMIMENGKWKIPFLKGKGAGGEAWFSAEQDLRYQKIPRFQIFGKKLKLNQLLPANSLLEGAASFKFYSVREPTKRNIVRGNLLIRDGSFRTASLLKAAGEVFGDEILSLETAFTSLGAWLHMGENKVYFDDVVLNSKRLSFRGEGALETSGMLDLNGRSVFNRRLSAQWHEGASSDNRLSMLTSIKGNYSELQITMDRKSIELINDKKYGKEISGRLDYLKFLNRQSPASIRVPDKRKFLETLDISEKKPKRKAGFFELLFGRRK